MIIIFTHYYGDPDGDSKEEIRKRSKDLLSLLFKNIMEKTKEVSEPIPFNLINQKYFNIYSNPKKDIHLNNNKIYREELFSEMIKLTKMNAMFSKLYILNFYKTENQH